MSPPRDFMQREEPSMEGITTTDENKTNKKRKLKQTTLNFTTKKQKTTHDPETNVSFDLLSIAIQGDIRSKQPPRLGSIENPRLRKDVMNVKSTGDYYYKIND